MSDLFTVTVQCGDQTFQRSVPKNDYQMLLKLISDSSLVGKQEVWLGDARYDEDGSFDAPIVVGGDNVVGKVSVCRGAGPASEPVSVFEEIPEPNHALDDIVSRFGLKRGVSLV